MRKLALVLVVALSAALLPAVAGAVPNGRVPAPIDPPVLRASGDTTALVHVVPEASLQDGVAAARRVGARIGTRYDSIGVFVAYASSGAFQSLALSDAIGFIEANRELELSTSTSHQATRGEALLDGSYPTLIDGAGVGVAIVDSGIDGTHPDLADRMAGNVKIVCASHATSVYVDPVLAPEQCIHPAGKVVVPMDDTDTPSAGGHGTHVAGIVAGTGRDSDGLYHGAAPGASLYGVSIGTAVTVENALDGLQWVLDNHDTVDPPIRVVNNSWGTDVHARYPEGGPQPGDFYYATWKLQDALVAAGVSVVQAAGNTGGNGSAATTSPQCVNQTPGIICVANYNDGDSGRRDGNIDGSSSRGQASADFVDTWPDVSAPGTRIVSTCRLTLPICSGSAETDGHIEDPPNRYARLTGTSMAAPHVAGIVAQLYQADPTLTPARVEEVIEDTAYKFIWGSDYSSVDPSNPDDATSFEKGHGLVDALAAVRFLREGQEPDPDPSPGWTPDPDPSLPPPGPAQSFYFHSTAGVHQADQLVGANTFDTTRPTRAAVSVDTPAFTGPANTDAMWTGVVEGPIQSLRLGFWQKSTDESTGSFGVFPLYQVTMEVGTGPATETYDLGIIDVETDGSELPTRVSHGFTHHFVADGPDPDGDRDRQPLSVDPLGRPVTLRIASTWFHHAGVILYDSAKFPSGFAVNPPQDCPEPGSSGGSITPAPAQRMFLHSSSRNGMIDAALGGSTFDASLPTNPADARFDDTPFIRNPIARASVDPNWSGSIDGVICNLQFDIWQKQVLDELVLNQAHYLVTLWVGDRRIDVPPIEVATPSNTADATRITFSIDQMLDEWGFPVPLMLDTTDEPVSIEIAGRYIDADVSTVIFYDSEARPSGFVVNEGFVSPPRTVGTELSFVDPPGSGEYSDETTFAALLVDAEGAPLPEEIVELAITGASWSATVTAQTSASGLATVPLRLNGEPGEYQVTVRYPGRAGFASSADSIGFVIAKEVTELDLVVDGNGSKRVLRARLTDSDEPLGIESRDIAFYSDGVYLATVATGSDGTASLIPPKQYQAGRRAYEARFAGDTYYVGSGAAS